MLRCCVRSDFPCSAGLVETLVEVDDEDIFFIFFTINNHIYKTILIAHAHVGCAHAQSKQSSYCFDCAIQETRFTDTDLDKDRLTLFGYSLYCDNVNTKPRRGGSALYVSNNLLHYQIFFDSPLNYVAINVKFAQREMLVISIYLPPSVTFREQLDQLLQQISSPCLILGDFNAHHLAWGCHTTNTRGTSLHSLLDKHHLVYLNDATPTYQCYRAGQASSSVIDLSLASPQIATSFTSEVQHDRYFSDHYPIHLILEIPSGQTNFNFLPRWNFNRAD